MAPNSPIGDTQQPQFPTIPPDVVVREENHDAPEDSCCRNFTNKVNHFLESGFEIIGFVVASNPWKVIGISLLISIICMAGILEYETENRGEKNWVSQDADPIKHKEWLDEVFPKNTQRIGLLMERKDGGNMLTKENILKLYEMDQKVRRIYNGTANKQWKDICHADGEECIPASILELWRYDFNEISSLTNDKINAKINTPNLVSPMTGKQFFVERVIGGPVIRDNGTIIGATVLKIDYDLKYNPTFDSSEGMDVDENIDDWAEAIEDTFEDQEPAGYIIFTHSQWSENKASSDSATGDLNFFIFGYILVIVYISTMLGSFSRLGHKVLLALSGIGIIGLSIGIAYGLGSAFQLKKTGVHDVLPFLLLGIGIDDVFVIVQSWENIGGSKVDHRTVPEKVASALKHAGVSVMVTSLTDICAFAVGSATILPALRSFSLWCAIGILAIFLLTITLFTAIMTLDARRQEQRRDAILCCMKVSEDYEPTKCSEKHYLKGFLKNYYSSILLSTPGKIIVLLAVAGLLAGGSYGLTQLEQDFDFIWFLPKDSRPRMYIERNREAFPGNGHVGNVYIGQIDYYKGRAEMDKVKSALENDKFVSEGTVHSWYHHYHSWLHQNHRNELTPQNCTAQTCQVVTEKKFYELLDVFLASKDGQNYQKKITFNTEKKIRASQISYNHIQLVGSDIQIDAMDSVTDTIRPGFISDGGDSLLPFAFSLNYINWETNKVISKELVRNITLATLCVFIVTLFLLSNLWTSLIVLTCVAFSLIEIAAFMGFWGLTIDTVTTIILVIAIGLTVDYSVHVAHGFMVAQGESRNERVVQTLYEVGPAVIHGGTSTFLAFVLLAASESYVFFTFFKVFFLVVVFGLFHGLVYLPVILSLIGPAPYASREEPIKKTKVQAVNNDVQLKKMTKTNEDNFVVVVKNGEKNLAYVPE